MLTFGEVGEKLYKEFPELWQILKEESSVFLGGRGRKENDPLCCGDVVIAMNSWLRGSYNLRMGKKALPEVVERLKGFMWGLRSEAKLSFGICETCVHNYLKHLD